jgi:ribonuclease HII
MRLLCPSPASTKSAWGARAGAVIAEAVILPRNASLNGVTDSKLLTAKRRATLFDAIREGAVAIGVGRVEDYIAEH